MALRPVRAGTLALVVLIALAACGRPDSPPTQDATASTAPRGAAPAAVGELPDLVGTGLQFAQDTAQAAGFTTLTSHDALGRGREQLMDRNWKVCFQQPSAGRIPTDATVDLGAVKLEDDCPATDQREAAPGPAGATMPDLVGKSAAVAQDSLGRNASITYIDGAGAGRAVLVASNWRICAQAPRAGQAFGGVPVRLTVVKFEESC